nr:ATP synthase F0 subunit 8 [Chalcopteryx rutilans]
MPQMAPMSWTLLFILFLIMVMITNTLNYYSYTPEIVKSESNKTTNPMKMKWTW